MLSGWVQLNALTEVVDFFILRLQQLTVFCLELHFGNNIYKTQIKGTKHYIGNIYKVQQMMLKMVLHLQLIMIHLTVMAVMKHKIVILGLYMELIMQKP